MLWYLVEKEVDIKGMLYCFVAEVMELRMIRFFQRTQLFSTISNYFPLFSTIKSKNGTAAIIFITKYKSTK